MKMRLQFDLDVNEQGWRDYHEQYPGFQEDQSETIAETLIREAIANWDSEGLLLGIEAEGREVPVNESTGVSG